MACTPQVPPAPLAAIEWTLPADLLLEIVARSDVRTLVRCAASCKLLRRDILSPPFLQIVTRGIIPQLILAYLHTHGDANNLPPRLSLVHPITPVALSFSHDNMSPFMSRDAHGLLGEYHPWLSRGGLVLLRRHRNVCNGYSDMCVYDLITGHRTFLSEPPGIRGLGCFHMCVLFTAADGINCSFLLFVADLHKKSSYTRNNTTSIIKMQTFASSTGTWGPVVTREDLVLQRLLEERAPVVILHGYIIHWLLFDGGKIFTYDVCKAERGTLEFPIQGPANTNFKAEHLQLGSYSSPEGRVLLRLFAAVGFKISVWHQLPAGGWAPKILIDIEDKLPTLELGVPIDRQIWFRRSGERSNVVSLEVNMPYRYSAAGSRAILIWLDLETHEIRGQHPDLFSTLLEIDLSARLRAMKIF